MSTRPRCCSVDFAVAGESCTATSVAVSSATRPPTCCSTRRASLRTASTPSACSARTGRRSQGVAATAAGLPSAAASRCSKPSSSILPATSMARACSSPSSVSPRGRTFASVAELVARMREDIRSTLPCRACGNPFAHFPPGSRSFRRHWIVRGSVARTPRERAGPARLPKRRKEVIDGEEQEQ